MPIKQLLPFSVSSALRSLAFVFRWSFPGKRNYSSLAGVTQMSLLQHQLKAMDEATKIVTNMEVGTGKKTLV